MSNQIQDKLLNYEAPPPEQAWNKIMAALESDSEFLLSKKLHDYQQAPSPDIWNHIKAKLDQVNTGAPAISFPKRRRAALVYSAAAAVITTMLISLLLFTKKPALDSGTVATKETSAPAGSPTPEPLPPAQGRTRPSETSIPRGKEPSTLPSASSSGRYMVVAGTTGEAVKVSKKLKDLFTCSEMDIYCRQQIEALQQRAAAADVMATADVSSVVDLLKSLENHQ